MPVILCRTLVNQERPYFYLYLWSKVKEARHVGLAAGAGTVSGRPAQATQRTDNIPYEVRGVGIQDGGLAPSGNRVSVYDAAKVLGVTADAIQKRILRGTMTPERDDNGRGWVLLGTSSTKPDNVQDKYRATSEELVGELRKQIRCLRAILSKEQDVYRRADAINRSTHPSERRTHHPRGRARSLTVQRGSIPSSASGGSPGG